MSTCIKRVSSHGYTKHSDPVVMRPREVPDIQQQIVYLNVFPIINLDL